MIGGLIFGQLFRAVTTVFTEGTMTAEAVLPAPAAATVALEFQAEPVVENVAAGDALAVLLDDERQWTVELTDGEDDLTVELD